MFNTPESSYPEIMILMCLVLEREGASGVIAWDVNIKVFIKSMERVGFILLGP